MSAVSIARVVAAMLDPNWQGIAVLEGYVLAGFVYLVFSFGLGVYGRFLERVRSADRQRRIRD